MKSIKKYKLVHETPAHFIMHDGQAHFHIAKKGLDKEITARIQGFAEGGDVKDEFQKAGEAISKGVSPEKAEALKNIFKAEGGEVEEQPMKRLEVDPPGTEILYDLENNEYYKEKPPVYNMAHGGLAENASRTIKRLRESKTGSGENTVEESRSPSNEAAPYNPEGEKRAEQRLLDAPDTLEELHARQKKQNMNKGGMVEKVMAAKEALSGKKKGYAGEDALPIEQEVTPQAPTTMEPQIAQEQQRLAVNSGMPGAVIAPYPGQVQPDTSAFREEAITNTAKNFVAQQEAAKMEAQQAEQTRQAEIQKVMSDNAARAAAGLPQLPVPQLQPSATPEPVAPGQQISFNAPVAQKNALNVTPSAAQEFERGSQLQQAGIIGKSQAEAAAAKTNEALLSNFVKQEQDRQKAVERHLNEIDSQNEVLRQDIMSRKIDPNRLWNNSSTGAKISAGLGIILGGLGAGMLGQTNNAALNFIQKAIDNDIEAQKVDTSTATNMYKMGLERYRNEQSAAQFATLQAHQILAAQIQQTAAKLGTQTALSNADIALGELAKADAPIKQNLAIQGAALSMLNQPGTPAQQAAGGVSPTKIRAMAMSGLLPKEELPKTIAEYGEYTKTKDLLDRTERVFSEGAKLATYTERLAKALPGGKMIPTLRESTKQYNAMVDSFLDKLTKDMTGRVTPESIKLLKESMPVAGDDENTRRIKLSNIRDIIKGSFAYPTLITYGIISENDPVVRTDAGMMQRFTPGKPKGK